MAASAAREFLASQVPHLAASAPRAPAGRCARLGRTAAQSAGQGDVAATKSLLGNSETQAPRQAARGLRGREDWAVRASVTPALLLEASLHFWRAVVYSAQRPPGSAGSAAHLLIREEELAIGRGRPVAGVQELAQHGLVDALRSAGKGGAEAAWQAAASRDDTTSVCSKTAGPQGREGA